MALASSKKRKVEDGIKGRTVRPRKKVRKQAEYHSSSEESASASDEGFLPVTLAEKDREGSAESPNDQVVPDVSDKSTKFSRAGGDNDLEEIQSSLEEDDDDEHDISGSTELKHKRLSKRNDPQAFSTSISKILSTKLSQSVRKDPLLSRSREAAQVSTDLASERLEKRARAKLRAERKEDLDRGRVKDVVGLITGDSGETAEEEKRLRKIAQRGVVKLFNAVRAAQVRGEEAAREERRKGTVGHANREEKVNEMSKQGFLDLISGERNVKPLEQA